MPAPNIVVPPGETHTAASIGIEQTDAIKAFIGRGNAAQRIRSRANRIKTRRAA